MVILVTNITDNSLTEELIKESFDKSEEFKGKKDIKEIIFLKSKSKDVDWKLNKIPIKTYEIDMDDEITIINKKIDDVLDPLFDEREYIQVIVDSSIFGFYMLDSMKKFNVKEVFIVKEKKLEKFQTCICET